MTKASDKVGLSQPAMINALSRVRGMFADELVVPTATGMKPTPRAVQLVDPFRQLLRQVERVLESNTGFDPNTITGFSHSLAPKRTCDPLVANRR